MNRRRNVRGGTRKRRLEGWGAIEFAERHGVRYVSKYADPTERAKKRITLDRARGVAREDSRLIYLDVSPKKLASNPARARSGARTHAANKRRNSAGEIHVGIEDGRWYFMREKADGNYWKSAARYASADLARKAAMKKKGSKLFLGRKKNPIRVRAAVTGKGTGWMKAKSVNVVMDKKGVITRVDVKR